MLVAMGSLKTFAWRVAVPCEIRSRGDYLQTGRDETAAHSAARVFPQSHWTYQ